MGAHAEWLERYNRAPKAYRHRMEDGRRAVLTGGDGGTVLWIEPEEDAK